MNNTGLFSEEKLLKAPNGMLMLLLLIAAEIGFLIMFFCGCAQLESGSGVCGAILAIGGGIMSFLICPILFAGLKVVKPNEALVLTLFGKYYGTLSGSGFYYVNPFVAAVNPTKLSDQDAQEQKSRQRPAKAGKKSDNASGKAVSLKVMTLNNERQKVNDKLGNPIEMGVVLIWRVVNAAKAVFNIGNYIEFLSIQADSSLRNIVRLYPYDIWDEDGDGDEMSLRGSSIEVAQKLRDELQAKVGDAGLEIVETRITHLAYAPEIAAAMLQRQQASAIIDARKLIVEGAVGMVDMALTQLSENDIVSLDDERKAQMVSNLLVVLCGSKEAQPIVNSGSIY